MSAIPLNPDSSRTQVSANQFKIQPQFEDAIRETLLQVQGFHELVITDLPLGWEEFLWEFEESLPRILKTYDPKIGTLRLKIMPTRSHNFVQGWLSNSMGEAYASQFLTRQEHGEIDIQFGTTLTFTSGPYRGLEKEPDALFWIPSKLLPSTTVEVGWSESYNDLLDDMNKLLVGGNGDIKAVILIKWTQHSNQTVSGILELYRLDRQGIPKLDQTEIIFPMPAGDPLQPLDIKRRDLYLVPPGRNPNEVFPLNIRELRVFARRNLAAEGYQPA
ncbi:hypothetical protein PMG11_05118 [Penicillium brasilianum]|uniref:Restriction endonuclease domain-containing protein n=1 Tax=Penicillium brasilianum TaxID=104259 RepID=A0A0F7VEJ6_PENBI|nr:hypothetical protein PMG11_05118 [Penicillium brasilianum]